MDNSAQKSVHNSMIFICKWCWWLLLLAVEKEPARDDEVGRWLGVLPAGVSDVVVEQLIPPDNGD